MKNTSTACSAVLVSHQENRPPMYFYHTKYQPTENREVQAYRSRHCGCILMQGLPVFKDKSHVQQSHLTSTEIFRLLLRYCTSSYSKSLAMARYTSGEYPPLRHHMFINGHYGEVPTDLMLILSTSLLSSFLASNLPQTWSYVGSGWHSRSITWNAWITSQS
jgi:hypothetical protein